MSNFSINIVWVNAKSISLNSQVTYILQERLVLAKLKAFTMRNVPIINLRLKVVSYRQQMCINWSKSLHYCSKTRPKMVRFYTGFRENRLIN